MAAVRGPVSPFHYIGRDLWRICMPAVAGDQPVGARLMVEQQEHKTRRMISPPAETPFPTELPINTRTANHHANHFLQRRTKASTLKLPREGGSNGRARSAGTRSTDQQLPANPGFFTAAN